MLVKRLSRQRNDTVEMKSTFFELMLNVMMRMISGRRYYGENVKEVEEVTTFREIVVETFRIGGATNIGEFLPFLRKIGFNGVEKEMQKLQEKREKFMKKLVEEHRREGSHEKSGDAVVDEGKKNKTLIQVLLSLQEAEPEYYQDVTIRSIMLVNSLTLFCCLDQVSNLLQRIKVILMQMIIKI